MSQNESPNVELTLSTEEKFTNALNMWHKFTGEAISLRVQRDDMAASAILKGEGKNAEERKAHVTKYTSNLEQQLAETELAAQYELERVRFYQRQVGAGMPIEQHTRRRGSLRGGGEGAGWRIGRCCRPVPVTIMEDHHGV